MFWKLGEWRRELNLLVYFWLPSKWQSCVYSFESYCMSWSEGYLKHRILFLVIYMIVAKIANVSKWDGNVYFLLGKLANLPWQFRFIHTFCLCIVLICLQILNLPLTSSAIGKTPFWFVCEISSLVANEGVCNLFPFTMTYVNHVKLLLFVTILDCSAKHHHLSTLSFNSNKRFQLLSHSSCSHTHGLTLSSRLVHVALFVNIVTCSPESPSFSSLLF